MEFVNPACLLLLLLLIPYGIWFFLLRGRKEPSMKIPSTQAYQNAAKSMRQRLMWVPFALRALSFAMVVVVLARPQSSNSWNDSEVEGIDIMLAMDVSTSMMAMDFKPNRVEAARMVATDFVSRQRNDNIGLTIFAGEAFTQCPLTTDHDALLQMFTNISCDLPATGMIDDGTAIGMGIANAASRLQESKAKSKVIILLTDGSNNMGEISPLTAAEMAKALGIRVYTIGVGTNGTATFPYPLPGGGVSYTRMPVEIDTNMLKEIASTTGGKFYRATNNNELEKIYEDISKLEKSRIMVTNYTKRHEAYYPFALIALIALLLELLLSNTLLKKIP
ncbi:MAG: VWA domain-containing protein [Bacteroidaceae bacterium]|nr:VWA domain-containing protein [Bacteroidaceae bacterium]MBP5731094.1 VWA domain-containing protein [Bacteroidaceae bacterium]